MGEKNENVWDWGVVEPRGAWHAGVAQLQHVAETETETEWGAGPGSETASKEAQKTAKERTNLRHKAYTLKNKGKKRVESEEGRIFLNGWQSATEWVNGASQGVKGWGGIAPAVSIFCLFCFFFFVLKRNEILVTRKAKGGLPSHLPEKPEDGGSCHRGARDPGLRGLWQWGTFIVDASVDFCNKKRT